MPALVPTAFVGEITYLGRVVDRAIGLPSLPLSQILARFSGPEGEDHGGLTRASCSRVLSQYKRGTEIRNTRQFSILSEEELAEIAAKMRLDRLDPSLVGASMVIRGIPDFTHIPPSSRLQGAGGATLVVDMENQSCQLPAKPIEGVHPGHGAAFKSAAHGRRGVTAWVEREGILTVGEKITLHVPSQRPWTGTI